MNANNSCDELLMRQAGKLLADERAAYIDRLNGMNREYSAGFRRKWKRLLRRTRTKQSGRTKAVSGKTLLRVLTVSAAAVLLMTAAAAVATVPAIREAVFRTRAQADTEGRVVHIELRVDEDAPFAETETGCEPAWIPEGYHLAHTNDQSEYDFISMTYKPEPEHDVYYPGMEPMWTGILFNRWTFNPSNPYTSTAIPDGGFRSMRTDPVQIGSYEGQLVRVVWNDGRVESHLFWTDSRYVYCMIADTEIVPGSSEDGVIRPLPLEDLLRMAWSVSADPGAADEAEIGAIAAELGREDSLAAGDLCPQCGAAEIRAVCTHDPIKHQSGLSVTGFASCIDPEHGEGCRARRTFCWTDYTCPACGYSVPGTEQHTETVIHTLPDGTEVKEGICGLPGLEE
jgi:hypothetical protein